jgi:predicted XRE-type DNA-binding protein
LNKDKFWSKVDIQTPDKCWEWQGSCTPQGYGQCWIPEIGYIGAHRMAYILTMGPIPDGLLIYHHCDNPSCVNPDHLFCGTHADNQADCKAKGRQFNGGSEAHRGEINSKLTENEIREIRLLLKEGRQTHQEIAIKYRISKVAIDQISSGQNWKWFEKWDVHRGQFNRGELNGSSKSTSEQVIEIKVLLNKNCLLQREISEMYGVSRATISDINTGKVWGWL